LSVIQALVLGLVQGLTEFIPVSSSAHLIIVPWLFGWDDPGLAYDVALHLGTLAALLWYFRSDWIRLVRAAIASIGERKIGVDNDRRLAWFLVIATIPGAIIGLLAESKIEELFHQPGAAHSTVAMISLAVVVALMGAILFIVERVARHRRGLDQISLNDGIIIGLAQGLAIFPGVSRSGSTITAGLALGLQRDTAARFSFLLSTPIILSAGLKSIWDLNSDLAAGAAVQTDWLFYIIGFVTAALSGYLCIRFLLKFLQQHSTYVFVYYRWALAILIIVVVFVRG
jgi:undecaprenyl-diphosphatase